MNKNLWAVVLLSLSSLSGCSNGTESDSERSVGGGGENGTAGSSGSAPHAGTAGGGTSGAPVAGGSGGLGTSGASTAGTSGAGTAGAAGAGTGGVSSGGSGGSSSAGGGGGGAAGGGGSAGMPAGSGGVPEDAMGSEGTPPVLSQAGLFEADLVTLANGVRPFQPQFQLWADSATKRRWIFLPEGTQINTTDMEYWEFPAGTRLYKEFSVGGKRIETRRLEKRENASWSRVSYLWREDQTEADAVPLGVEDASSTEHDVPSAKSCGDCHLRMPDKVLGFSAIQLAHEDPDETAWTLERLAADGRLTSAPPADIQVPGDDTARAALGYFHANCGHCHNPLSVVTSRIEINLWLRTDSLADVTSTPTYQTTVDQQPLSETQPPSGARIIDPGVPENSTLFLRIDSRAEPYSMPPLATEMVDPSGRDAVEAWIRSLGN